MLIRPAVPTDVPARVAVHRACISYSMANEALMSSPDEPGSRTLRLVAEVDGKVVGSGTAQLDVHGADGTGSVSVMVVPEHRGGGVGGALYRRLDAHLGEVGARRITANTFSDDAVGFGERRGFTIGLATRVSESDPAGVEAVTPPPGVTVRSAAELPDLRSAHEVALAFGPDVPSSTPFVPQPYDAWVAARSSGIGLDRETSFVVFDGDVPVALTLTSRIENRLITRLTGTHPEHRRRGLARLAKTASLSAAAAAGVVRVYTFNEVANEGILAVNERLGYRPHMVVRELVREPR
ncbi:GNAT family N-acetyltransferase [Phytomonospora endophytica]|uniref:RimJ/RimL family protein N-acetyltransferase n=1 Tax=Phytomonospora endophytica TaxID=714109 RepID=A0A841FRP9_9ACTN|nr:GNAT family N-acetyltransferase [Phytomonospora endophytica]MBB6036222.1 RimJ/RimL family protein N-acetyltransferase [Phytomonospora endophytica]GIG67128.1 hypothetical protein Pen01_34230 [Phytomonospora endophytica]